jgi:hypothetical protein
MAYEHTFINKGGQMKTKVLTGMSAIREKCLECSNWFAPEVKQCPATDCALWPFRMGRYPREKGAKGQHARDLATNAPNEG